MCDDLLSVLAENVSELRKTADALAALTNVQIHELSAAAKEHTDPTVLFRAVFGEALVTPEYALFCRRLLGGRTDKALITALLPEFTPLGDAYADGEAAYPPNPVSNAAFQRFAERMPALRAQNQPSFSAACEEVYHGRCRYCILPLQNTQDGVLASFSHLIAKYELKILRVCDIAADDGESVIRFALLRRGVVPHVPDEGFFEIGVVLPEQISIGAFLRAADALGARIEHLRTVPLTFASGHTSLSVAFRITRECMAPLMLFLRTALDGYTPEGIYETVDHP